ncbi:MAG: hypothetical protein NTV34_19060, partial [Proteobacteria bacterium]|nr:hypothetical protein [Pseudomonadota bacterium]
YTAEEILVLNRITEIKALSFASTNRTLNLQCLSREQRRQAILQAIGAMKQEVKVAGVQAPETIPELLHQIIALNKVLTSLQSPTGGRA